MTQWVRGFVIPEVADVHLAFASVITTAAAIEVAVRGSAMAGPAAATLRELRRAYVDFNDNLRYAAEQGAMQATRDIRARLAATQVRPDTRTSPHLRDLIYCAPLSVGSAQTGMVGVGRVSTLNRAINKNTPGYGTYWRAQEYGTGGGEVPSQIGRVILGSFVGGAGGAQRPLSQYAGGGGPHPIFVAASQRSGRAQIARGIARGGEEAVGWGTIGHEIRPRRFIGLGADGAAVRWREQIAALQARAIDEIAAVTAP